MGCPVAEDEGVSDLPCGALGALLVGRVYEGERPPARLDLLTQPRHLAQPNAVIDNIGLTRASTAQCHDGDPHCPHVDRRDDPSLVWVDSARHGRLGEEAI